MVALLTLGIDTGYKIQMNGWFYNKSSCKPSHLITITSILVFPLFNNMIGIDK